jgi:serine/threonine protein kinase
MLFGEYPYEGKRDMMIIKQIESDKKIKECDDKELQDLMSKMLKKNVNERISWNEYFNHPFFKKIFEIHQEKNDQKNYITASSFKTNQVLFKEVQGILELSKNYCNLCRKFLPNNENELKNFTQDLKYIINYYENNFKKV